MKNKFISFPELLLVDATYKLNNLRMPVFVQLIVDGNGESEIVSIYVAVIEEAETISALVRIFQNHNPSWVKTKTILTDKDLVERKVYGDLFPGASLQLCLFHVLRSMKREIHCEKMGISLGQKNACLEIIQNIAYSFSDNEYERHLELLRGANVKPVTDFYMKCWHPIKEEWVLGLKQSCHYGNQTTNRLESINQKIKQVVVKFSNLKTFFDDLSILISCLRQERDYRLSNLFMKHPVVPFTPDSAEARFMDLLTPYAFQIVLKQIEVSQKIYITEIGPEVSLDTSGGFVTVTMQYFLLMPICNYQSASLSSHICLKISLTFGYLFCRLCGPALAYGFLQVSYFVYHSFM